LIKGLTHYSKNPRAIIRRNIGHVIFGLVFLYNEKQITAQKLISTTGDFNPFKNSVRACRVIYAQSVLTIIDVARG
jgi:hypothetical protein